MTEAEITQRVLEQYKATYNGCNADDFRVHGNTFGGHLVSLRLDHKGKAATEICFVEGNGKVKIFTSTPELAYFLNLKANEKIIDKIFRKDIFSSIVLLLLIVSVIAIGQGYMAGISKEAFDVLKNLTVLAAGFYFGANVGTSR